MAIRLIEDDEPQQSTEELMVRAQTLHAQQAAITEQMKATDAELSARLNEEQSKARTIQFNAEKQLRVVRVANARIKVDEAGLAKALGKRAYASVSDLKINLDKLNVAVLEKTVDKEKVSAYVTTEEHPYLRFYLLDRRDDAGDAEGR